MLTASVFWAKEKVDADNLSKEDRKALKQIETDAVPRMNRYKEQLETMAFRNHGYSLSVKRRKGFA